MTVRTDLFFSPASMPWAKPTGADDTQADPAPDPAAGNPYYIDPVAAETNPQKATADLIKAQDSDFAARYRPIEDQLINYVNSDNETEAAQAGADANRSATLSREQFIRDLSRTGTNLTARQSGQVDRKLGLSQARAVANAENTTRSQLSDQKLQAKADLIGIGKGIVGSASQGLSNASGNQQRRDAANRAAKDAHRGQVTGLVSTGLGLAAAFLLA